jgi:uncharacterized oxidoreductase
MELSNRTILITGGTSGIGRALVAHLAPRNRKIVVLSSTRSKLTQLTEAHSNVHTCACSLDDDASLQEAVTTAIGDHADLSVVINNAGIQYTPELLSDSFKYHSVDREIAVNLAAPIKICALVLLHLSKLADSAALVNISSGLALYPKTTSAVYCATKAGIHNFSRSLRYQLESTKISVHEAILPLVDTPMTRGRGKGKLSAEQAAEAIIRGVERGKQEIYVGKARLIPPISRISPRLMAAILKSS